MDKNKKKLEESKTGKWKEKKSFVYRISANSCRDNYLKEETINFFLFVYTI